MMTKQEYMTRPEDTNLGPIWNSMRARQRELSWPAYWMNCQMAQYSGSQLHGCQNFWGALLGETVRGAALYDPQTP